MFARRDGCVEDSYLIIEHCEVCFASNQIFFSDGLDAIRDSRIAAQKWLSGRFLVTFAIRGWQPVRFREDCERGANGIIYRKAMRR